MEMGNSYYGFLLQFITDITEFYYGYYGTFLKDFIDSEPRHQKSLETLIFEKKLENRADLLRKKRNITDITEIAITEYYGYITVCNIPPPVLMQAHTSIQ